MANTHKTKVINVDALQWSAANLDTMRTHCKKGAETTELTHVFSSDDLKVIFANVSVTKIVKKDSWVIVKANLTLEFLTATAFTAKYETI